MLKFWKTQFAISLAVLLVSMGGCMMAIEKAPKFVLDLLSIVGVGALVWSWVARFMVWLNEH